MQTEGQDINMALNISKAFVELQDPAAYRGLALAIGLSFPICPGGCEHDAN